MDRSRAVTAGAEPDLDAALSASFFAMLPRGVRDELIAAGVLRDVPARGPLTRVGGPPMHAVVVNGLVRTFASMPDGRQVTLQYARPGAWLGVMPLPEGPFPCVKAAVTDSRVLSFPPQLIHRIALADTRFCWGIAGEITMLLYQLYDEVARHILSPLADRVAHHLLESALAASRGGGLVSPLRQQELADAVGSPRESVARTLKVFRDDGLIEMTRVGVRILRPDELGLRRRRIAWRGAPAPTRRPSGMASAGVPRSADFTKALHAAIGKSALGTFSAPPRRRLLDVALRLDIPAGSVLYRAGDAPRNGLLVEGLVRSYAVGPDGRQFTLVHSRPGSWLGLPTVPDGPFPLDVEAVTDVIAMEFPADAIRRIALSEPVVAWTIAEELTRRLYRAFDQLTDYVFAPVRKRIALRLLELAVCRREDGALIAPVSVGELAASIGATPSSTSRVLRAFRAARAIRSEHSGIRILNAAALDPHTWT